MPFGTIAATGFTSGLNLYGTALLLGILGRLGYAPVPALLTTWWMLALMAFLYAMEFVADKIPWLDSAWDTVHTAIRPIGAAVLGAAIAQSTGGHTADELLAAVTSGGMAFSAHAAKASTRALVNTSPEPVSNVALSLAEDGVAAGLVALAVAYPVPAGILAAVLAVGSLVVAFLLLRAIRRMVRGLKRRWRRWFGEADRTPTAV